MKEILHIQWNLWNPIPKFSDILWRLTKIYGPKVHVFLLTKIKPEYSDILYNPTHFPGPWCVTLDRFWHPVQSNTFPWSLVCRIRQVLTSCTIRHISLVLGVSHQTGSDILYNLTHFPGPWCVTIDRFWHPVQSDTFPWSLVCHIRYVLTSCTIWHISLVLGVSH